MKVESLALVMHRVDNKQAAFVHSVLQTDKGFVLDAGRVLARSERDAVICILQDKTPKKRGIIPSTVLMFDDDVLAWYRPAGVATLGFSQGQIEVHVPALVFAIENGRMRVAAMKSSDRPDEATPLWHSGFPNVSRSGDWCAGANRIPDQPRIEHIGKYEECFFESRFTHDGGSQLKGVKNVMEFWTTRGVKRFANTRLLSMKKTLGQWVFA